MPDSVADGFHRLTKYTAENVRGGPGLDWSRQPPQVKEIVSHHRVSLRPYIPFTPSGEVDLAPPIEPDRLGLATLSRLLFYTNGVTGLVRYQRGRGQFLRAAPSAGALYPTEIYLAARAVPDLEPGLYNYQVPSHELVRLWEEDPLDAVRGACGQDARFEGAPLCIIFTALFWRSAWRYQERGYRRALLDTGHAIGNLATYAPQVGLTAHPFLGFMDSELNGLFFFDDAVEATLACVPVTEEESLCVPGALWASMIGDPEGLEAVTIRTDADLAESATIRLHRASACGEKRLADDADGLEPPVSDRSIPLSAPADLAESIPHAILNRRSARRYRNTSLPLEALGQTLGFAFGRDGRGRTIHFGTRDAGVMRAHVLAFAIDGLDAGLYAVEGAGEALLPLAIGDFRAELGHASLGQEIARDCAATLILSASGGDATGLYGERSYRYLHLEAGEIGERFQLAAQSLGMAACGIAGFLDDDVAGLVEGTPNDWVLYLVTIGNT